MKAFISSIFVLVGCGSALAQGTVIFANSPNLFSDGIDRLVYSFGAGAPLVGTNFVAQLLYGADASSLTPVTSAPAKFHDTTAAGTVLAGTWSGGTRTLGTMIPGMVATLDMVYWDVTKFPDLSSAMAGGGILGDSGTFTYLIPQPGSPPAAFTMTGLRAFASIPEPSVAVFGFLGTASLLLFFTRVRKNSDSRFSVTNLK